MHISITIIYLQHTVLAYLGLGYDKHVSWAPLWYGRKKCLSKSKVYYL